MNKASALAGGIGLGALMAYYLDPLSGKRRRALLRDQAIRTVNRTRHGLDLAARDMAHRAQGLAAEARTFVKKDSVSDDVLAERIRSKIGRVCSHPHAVQVKVANCCATLRGHILEHEHKLLLRTVEAVHGVDEVRDELQSFKQPFDIPDLQGGKVPPGDLPDLLQRSWAPATRLMISAAGGMMFLAGMRQKGLSGAVLGLAGGTMIASGLSNMDLRRMLGIGGGRRGIDIRKTIHINATVEHCFEFWSRFENFPLFMSHLREVRIFDNGLSRWIARAGPAGIPVQWDAIVTCYEQNKCLAWKTVPGSAIAHAGSVQFEPGEHSGTRITLRMTYNPPAGAVGHAIASLLGVDPKSQIDEDMVRLKGLLEQGKTRGECGTVTAQQIEAIGAEMTLGAQTQMEKQQQEPAAPR